MSPDEVVREVRRIEITTRHLVRDIVAGEYSTAFRGQEVATTRLQVKAISFAGTRPVQTGCGPYTVTASLSGGQPITEMVIVRNSDQGGSFFAPLSLNVKLAFTPVRGGAPVEVVRNITFPAKSLSVWSEAPGRHATYDSLSVDSDLTRRGRRILPGTRIPRPASRALLRPRGGQKLSSRGAGR
jgi:hypothetical protein